MERKPSQSRNSPTCNIQITWPVYAKWSQACQCSTSSRPSGGRQRMCILNKCNERPRRTEIEWSASLNERCSARREIPLRKLSEWWPYQPYSLLPQTKQRKKNLTSVGPVKGKNTGLPWIPIKATLKLTCMAIYMFSDPRLDKLYLLYLSGFYAKNWRPYWLENRFNEHAMVWEWGNNIIVWSSCKCVL